MGAASPTRTCPECGTPNNGFNLFCSECGSSLTSAVNHPVDEPDNQATAAFRPVADDPVASDPYATQQYRVTAASSPHSTAADMTSASPAWTPPAASHVSVYEPEENRRGLVLGWIAAILILLVIGYLGWTSFLDVGTRDSITGVFG